MPAETHKLYIRDFVLIRLGGHHHRMDKMDLKIFQSITKR